MSGVASGRRGGGTSQTFEAPKLDGVTSPSCRTCSQRASRGVRIYCSTVAFGCRWLAICAPRPRQRLSVAGGTRAAMKALASNFEAAAQCARRTNARSDADQYAAQSHDVAVPVRGSRYTRTAPATRAALQSVLMQAGRSTHESCQSPRRSPPCRSSRPSSRHAMLGDSNTSLRSVGSRPAGKPTRRQ